MVKIAYSGYQSRTVGGTVSDRQVATDRRNQRTAVIEMLSPLRVLASHEVCPSLEDEIDTYENRGVNVE